MSAAPEPAFDAQVAHGDGRAVVTVRGEIDLATADRFRAVLASAIDRSPCVVIDLRGTTFMDSTGLAVLVGAGRRLGWSGDQLVVRDPSPQVRRVLDVAGLSAALRICTAPPEAAEG